MIKKKLSNIFDILWNCLVNQWTHGSPQEGGGGVKRGRVYPQKKCALGIFSGFQVSFYDFWEPFWVFFPRWNPIKLFYWQQWVEIETTTKILNVLVTFYVYITNSFRYEFTYIVSPGDFVWSRVGFDWAFKVDIIPFLDVWSIQAGPQG